MTGPFSTAGRAHTAAARPLSPPSHGRGRGSRQRAATQTGTSPLQGGTATAAEARALQPPRSGGRRALPGGQALSLLSWERRPLSPLRYGSRAGALSPNALRTGTLASARRGIDSCRSGPGSRTRRAPRSGHMRPPLPRGRADNSRRCARSGRVGVSAVARAGAVLRGPAGASPARAPPTGRVQKACRGVPVLALGVGVALESTWLSLGRRVLLPVVRCRRLSLPVRRLLPELGSIPPT
jgi:hypothetical protein